MQIFKLLLVLLAMCSWAHADELCICAIKSGGILASGNTSERVDWFKETGERFILNNNVPENRLREFMDMQDDAVRNGTFYRVKAEYHGKVGHPTPVDFFSVTEILGKEGCARREDLVCQDRGPYRPYLLTPAYAPTLPVLDE